ncbi:hypothetical protein pqer_cds_736 [Pandoravirus quercus]|uniref:Uncharacterized protein n=1 Tax=Pandoravirus quercus TaxID=2107709 RepID=A0A2U7U9N1_9VIRU|nr:hypothetical protein pqer_cds_736 [Pandoravirus quercus]AVK75158.1 hypothetical protein pqer_cds_736 [Pandoravirus quercus]
MELCRRKAPPSHRSCATINTLLARLGAATQTNLASKTPRHKTMVDHDHSLTAIEQKGCERVGALGPARCRPALVQDPGQSRHVRRRHRGRLCQQVTVCTGTQARHWPHETGPLSNCLRDAI